MSIFVCNITTISYIEYVYKKGDIITDIFKRKD